MVGIDSQDFAVRRKGQGEHVGRLETCYSFPAADLPYAKAIAAGDQPSPVRTEENISANPGRDIFLQLAGSGIPNLDDVAASVAGRGNPTPIRAHRYPAHIGMSSKSGD